ncbi:MAG: secondary thiamine-phosphate synthase enzyme YjbQ [Lysobacterales bacterium]
MQYTRRMRQATHILSTDTDGPGLYEITHRVADWCRQQSIQEGLLTLFIRHTSASLTIQENADPDVCLDLVDFFSRIAPHNGPYRHTAEGPDDMPAHIKSALTQVQLSIPLQNGHLALGTWQGIYVFEHRHQRHRRQVALHLLGD